MKKQYLDLAILGSGPSAIYLLRHIVANATFFTGSVRSISIFEQSSHSGYGMPYSPETTDRYNLSNITSAELPPLPETFAIWLLRQDDSTLAGYQIERERISENEVYSRLALGGYFREQYLTLLDSLRAAGLEVTEFCHTTVTDIIDHPSEGVATVVTDRGDRHPFDRIVIATGHSWPGEDKPRRGYFSSPWPIFKLLPAEGTHLNTKVGTLGASLSAFDVVTSLAHRHGKFSEEDGTLIYDPAPRTEGFSITMHAACGWLPHLQYEQEKPYRKIYRHVDRESLFGLLDSHRFLRLDKYFDKICRPALVEAFSKDERRDLVKSLANPSFGLDDFVAKMESEHEYSDSFAGMKRELAEAVDSAATNEPAHWKEVIDDLIYTLNYHAELMPAEDHIRFHKVVMPFLMNVIAAIPISSARIMLALHDAGKLDLVSGHVEVDPDDQPRERTRVSVEREGEKVDIEYGMFVDCSGQKSLDSDEYPFPSLVRNGTVGSARIPFADPSQADTESGDDVVADGADRFYLVGGIGIDASYRVMGKNGNPNQRIFDIAFPHTLGIRPYSYGLQACSCTAEILVNAWMEALETDHPTKGKIAEVAEIYEEIS